MRTWFTNTRSAGSSVSDRGGVRLDVCVALGRREVLQQARLEALVLVEHEDREQPLRQLGDDDARAPDVVDIGVPFLAEDHDLVPKPAPLAGERTRVDVRARAAEQVAVPDHDPHGWSRYVRWK